MARSRLSSLSFLTLVSVLGLAACGQEVGRVSCEQGTAKTSEFEIEGAKPAAFWTDLDVEYDGNPEMYYEIEVELDGEVVAERTCHALDVNTKINSVTSDMGNHHTRRWQGKMKCEPFELEDTATVKITSIFDVKGEGAAVSGCDLVVKQ